MNTKRRCTFCKDYYDADSADSINVGLSGVCSTGCLNDLKEKARNKRARRKEHRANRIRYGRRLNPDMRETVRNRDKHMCRFCKRKGGRLEIHHINYRSQGGSDDAYNLILLCDDHHRLIHTNKKHWQPILKMVQVAYYWNNKRVLVPRAERMMEEDWYVSGLTEGPDAPGVVSFSSENAIMTSSCPATPTGMNQVW